MSLWARTSKIPSRTSRNKHFWNIAYKNGLEINPNNQKRIKATSSGSASFIIPALVKISNVALAVGDIIDVRSTSTAPAAAFLNFGVLTINRLS